MKITLKLIYALLSVIFILYLAKPNINYPDPPYDSVQSKESGDTEDPLRRAYFTNYSREQTLTHYLDQMKGRKLLFLNLPVYKLNYPPEEASALIRDQTRSTFLEEIVHPLRESFFVNGFEPSEKKDEIIIDSTHWELKITTRLVQSSVYARLLVGIAIVIVVPIISLLYKKLFNKNYA